jgi:predicted DsbA family dithiol-disulfide isomerase
MGGLARELSRPLETMRHVLDAGEASGMPVDPRLWLDHPPRSSYPACQAVKAAAEQGLDGPYLRVVREGLMARRQKLDTADTLVAAARGVAGMDVARFAVDLQSAAIVEAFGADLDRARAAALDGEPRVALPSFAFRGEDGEHWARDESSPAAARPPSCGAWPPSSALARSGC